MSKKGFTLIELVAVIAVLGVILAIAVPMITGVIQNSTKKGFVSDAKMVLKALEFEKTNDKHFDQTIVTKSNIYSLLGISSENYTSVEIMMDEDLPFVKIVGAGKWDGLIICGTEDDLEIVADASKCVIDHVTPVITITGSNPANVNINTTYTDAGATATDNVDGDITSKIVTTSNVNTSAPGTYSVTYRVTDEAGNIGTATRTVNVIDNVGPTIVINPSSSTTYTKSKSIVVTVTDISGVNDSTLVYSFSTGNVTPPPANVFNKPYTNGGTITLSTGTGIYYLWAKAYDSLGNARTVHTTGAFYVDNTAPVITVTGTNPVSINVGSTYTDEGATATDANSGVNGTVTSSSNVNPNAVGSYTVTYTATDNAGNVNTATRTVNVTDSIAPTIAFGTNGNSTYAKTRSTTVTVSDNVSLNTSSLKYLWSTSATAPAEASITSSFTNGGTISTPAGVTGSYYLWILGKDTSGNTTITGSNVFNLDNTVPVITMTGTSPVSIGVGNTYTDAGTMATDAHSGVNGSVTSSSNVNPNVVGTYTITYNVSDKAGNAATPVTRTVNVIQIVPDGWIAISTPADLYNMRNNLTGKYFMLNDINLAGTAYDTWTPISGFLGSLDGNGKSINGLKVTSGSQIGLFSTLDSWNGEIKNLNLTNVSLSGMSYVGAVAGFIGYINSSSGKITAVNVSGNISGTISAGGIAGYTWGTTVISQCSSSATVSGGDRLGGLIGQISGSETISYSYSTGNVSGMDEVGGLIGMSNASSPVITKSYATGNVSGQSSVGGLMGNSAATVSRCYATGNVSVSKIEAESTNISVGGLIGVSTGNISDSYAIGNIYATHTYQTIGGLVGLTGGNITVSRSYAAENIVSTYAYAKGPVIGNGTVTLSSVYFDKTIYVDSNYYSSAIGKTTSEMYSQATYSGWDFTNVWYANGSSYPTLR